MLRSFLARAAVLLFVRISIAASVGDAGDLYQCKEACAESFFLLPQIEDVQGICQRGCRIFNIIYLREDHDLNSTKEECHLSCKEAYTAAEPLKACEVGCSEAWKRKEASDLSQIPLFLQLEHQLQHRQQDRSGGVIVEPELEIVESDLILEPLMQNQIEIIGYSVEYKIPEAKIQTMPIDDHWRTEDANDGVRGKSSQQPTGDWLDCASRNSGIPKWFLLLGIVVAILAALLLSISSERKLIIDVEDDFDLEARVLIEADRRCRKERELEVEADELPPKQPPPYECSTEKTEGNLVQV